MRGLRSRPGLFVVLFFASLVLVLLSVTGALAPFESVLSIPLNVVQGVVNDIVTGITTTVEDFADIRDLQERNRDLERSLAKLQAELIELREIKHDYERIAGLLEYTTTVTDREYVAANVIGLDTSGFMSVMYINRGARDGIEVGMPVVTDLGLVGRVTQVRAAASQVLLINDPNSCVSVRLQATRTDGSVCGQLSGTLRMELIPLDEELNPGDLVVTSGLGGKLPPGLVIGQVTSVRRFEFELFQEAEVRSLNDFNRLEFVTVITSFEPVDLSGFGPPVEETEP
ncbi:MAG: rod shape-determining protein MreC [Anaerolineae bacterium]|nr:rod shape-determining protein MreC [Anaerolineae bacterium]